ncbi:CCR4-NOT transcription complex subunit 11-like [Harpegnathos saltator]|uniref:CCR4-NOT transcription complex subunit 11-like n=1 Tax=Harpegnathos saltator TaxID=610380 RepID=UPI000DBEE710|nr:CCR4-NOT transcription complex subunit 11-like [Harpegnathos saltator]
MQSIAPEFLQGRSFQSEPLASTPFAPVFVQMLKAPQENTSNGIPKLPNHIGHIPSLSTCEKNLLANLIGYNQKEIMKKTPRQIMDEFYFASVPSIDLTNLQLQLAEHHSELPSVSKCGHPVILPDMDQSKVTELDKRNIVSCKMVFHLTRCNFWYG